MHALTRYSFLPHLMQRLVLTVMLLQLRGKLLYSQQLKHLTGCTFSRTRHTTHPILTFPTSVTFLAAAAGDSPQRAIVRLPYRLIKTAVISRAVSYCRTKAVKIFLVSSSFRSLTSTNVSQLKALTLALSPNTPFTEERNCVADF